MEKDFKQGDIIEYAGDKYIVVENSGSSGYVQEYFNDNSVGEDVIKFYWYYDGEECSLVRRAG
jgi:NMD protein affecting ribosome stability and mRNA decay